MRLVAVLVAILYKVSGGRQPDENIITDAFCNGFGEIP